MSKISPCLWFASEAEEAVKFYVSLLPDSRVIHVQKNVTDSPSGKEGSVLVVYFTLAGQTLMALNGGQKMDYSYALSLSIDCEDQKEVDRIWDAILKNGGRTEQCGWIRDRWNVPWQIIPKALPKLIGDPDPAKARRVMDAMMQMVKIDVAALEAAYAGKAA
jgi:predicted 3-demethylubiquinone-9 3-methyltransferase (glyoxalase superfamily)